MDFNNLRHFGSVLNSVSQTKESFGRPLKRLCSQRNMALKSVMSNLVSDVSGHSHDGHSTCLADGHHGHAFGPMASSFTAFFPDAVAPHHSDHFLPSISGETVHQGDSAHLDQFDQSLLATRRPKNYVSFHEKEEEKKEGEWVNYSGESCLSWRLLQNLQFLGIEIGLGTCDMAGCRDPESKRCDYDSMIVYVSICLIWSTCWQQD